MVEAAGALSLELRDFESLARYQWVLTGPDGVIASHQVSLDTSLPEYEAFTALHDYLQWATAPDPWTRAADEARIVGKVGEWIGAEVLDPIAPAIAAEQPATVQVIVPPTAADLLFCPLELAYAAGKPLAIQNVSLVLQVGDERGVAPASQHAPTAGRLRVLGLFSLPTGERALNMRGERQALMDVFAEMTAAGRAVEMRVLQYGVTRQRLQEILEEEDGWDLIHISGHGAPGRLLLETDEGAPDVIGATDLASLLSATQERLKLVMVSACWSAAPSTAGTLLGLPFDSESKEQDRELQAGSNAAHTLASELVSRLGCAVLAMRYAVTEDFANSLAVLLYRRLAGDGLPLPRALSGALKKLAGSSDGATFPGAVGCYPRPAWRVSDPADPGRAGGCPR